MLRVLAGDVADHEEGASVFAGADVLDVEGEFVRFGSSATKGTAHMAVVATLARCLFGG